MTMDVPNSLTSPLRRTAGERGMTLIEMLAAMAIGTLVLSTIYLALGTAIRARLLVESTVHGQQHGRLVIQWVADRMRQAGYGVAKAHPVARCRDALVVEEAALRPTSSQVFFNTDLDGTGAGEPTQTIGFRLGTEMVRGTSVAVLRQSVTDCAGTATPVETSITDPTSVAVDSLVFTYYDRNGTVVGDLSSPVAIRSIRMVRVAMVERAAAGAMEPRVQTWNVLVNLRNPDPRTL